MTNDTNDYIIITAIISGCLVVITIGITIIISKCKTVLLKMRLQHETDMLTQEFAQKQKWQELINTGREKQEDEDWIKEKNEIKKHVDELWEKRNAITPLDMNRIALLHLILSGNKEGITAENLEKEIEKVKKSYKIIEQQLKY